ncbi:MAG: DMT family transporter [Pseudomonadota bacterium]|nr:DMT family transporter [Pseudomonadota bacterium]
MPDFGPLPDEGSRARSDGFIGRRRRAWAELPGNVRGGLWLLVAAGFFTAMVTLIKIAGARLHVTEILLFRQIFMMLLALPVILRDIPGALRTARLDLQLLRIAAAVTAMTLGFTAFIHLPLADAVTIGFARGFFILIFAILLLGESVGWRRWAAIAVGFCGVFLVMQPGEGGFDVYSLMALCGAAGAGLVMVIIRKLSQTDRPVTILAFQAFGVGVLVIPPALWFWRTPTLEELLLLAAIGVVSALSQLSNIFAYRAGEASAIAPLDYARLIYAVILGLVVFGDWPGGHVFLGAAVIVAAGLYTFYRERRLGRMTSGAPG